MSTNVLESEDYPASGYKTTLTSYKNEDSSHSHFALLEVVEQGTGQVVYEQQFSNKSEGKKFMHELTREDLP